MSSKPDALVWMDLEMTGLNPERERIIEMATVVTTPELELIAEGPNLVIHQSDDLLADMDEWNTNQHGESGLTDAVRASTISEAQAEADTLAFLQQYVAPGSSPLCGSSICLDRRFLIRYMPTLESFLHYRHLDVSSFKIVANHWRPSLTRFSKDTSNHRALGDVHDSINELRYYREHLFQWEDDE